MSGRAEIDKKGVRFFFCLVLLYAAVFAARHAYLAWIHSVWLVPGKPRYFHYDIIDVRLNTRDPALRASFLSSPPRAVVTRNGERLTTIAGLREIPLVYNEASGDWRGRWPCPWNAPAGEYKLEFLASPKASLPEGLTERLKIQPFHIVYRKPHPVAQGFAALSMESVMPLATMKVRAPDGVIKDWRGLLDWAQHIGADAFWMLGGETPGTRPGEVWIKDNFAIFPQMARECRKRGLKFGLYVMCYLTMSDSNKVSAYQYAREVVDGRSVETRAISINDPRRPLDVLELLKKFRDIPHVDFVGVDYIRNALGGYELAEDFYKEMPGVVPPPDWPRLSPEERMVYFARKKIMRRDAAFIDAWQWWRAHRVARIVRRIKLGLGDSKPLWAFTLTWDKGWHHGQDSVMMNDAGMDMGALMLYEADEPQFGALLKAWHSYVKRGDAQLLVGDVVDWPLHQRDSEGPKAFSRRMKNAVDRIYADGPARGVFIHDLSRALWGRIGPWSTRQWMDEARESVLYLKSRRAPQEAGAAMDR